MTDKLPDPGPPRHFDDLRFYVVAKAEGTHAVEFEVFDVTAWDNGKPLFDKAAAEHPCDFTADVAGAARFAHGSVKWDGCSNWHFDEQDDCMIHGCSRADVVRLGEVLGRCWDWAREVIPNFDAR